jgi:hypothetical protein
MKVLYNPEGLNVRADWQVQLCSRFISFLEIAEKTVATVFVLRLKLDFWAGSPAPIAVTAGCVFIRFNSREATEWRHVPHSSQQSPLFILLIVLSLPTRYILYSKFYYMCYLDRKMIRIDKSLW